MQGLQGGGTDTLANEGKKRKQNKNLMHKIQQKTRPIQRKKKNMTQLDLFSNPIQLK